MAAVEGAAAPPVSADKQLTIVNWQLSMDNCFMRRFQLEKLDERTYKFALRVIKMVNALPNTKVSEVLGRQVLRSATSVGANVEEALGAISKREFIQKMSIAAKEARETHYWLRLIRDAGLLSANQLNPLIQEALEIKMILSKTVKTSKERYGKK